MLVELCFNALFGGPVNFHFAGEGLLLLSLAYCHLSSNVPCAWADKWPHPQPFEWKLPPCRVTSGISGPKAAVSAESFCLSLRPSMLLPSQMICLGSSNSELPGMCSVPEVQSPSGKKRKKKKRPMGSDTSQKSNSRHEVTYFIHLVYKVTI